MSGGRGTHLRHRFGVSRTRTRAHARRECFSYRFSYRFRGQILPPPWPDSARKEIGRASCRERV